MFEKLSLGEEEYEPEVFENGDTRKQLLARSRYLLFKSRNKWTESQKKRAKILFELYPDIENAYNLTDELRRIYSSTKIKGVAYTNWLIGISMWKMRDTIRFRWSSRPSMKTI